MENPPDLFQQAPRSIALLRPKELPAKTVVVPGPTLRSTT